MSPEVLSHVFEPFFTTKDVGQGTGLGLAQVYGFARQSGGTVRISSQSGQGTTVSLLLPRSHGAARPMPIRSGHPPADAAAHGSVLLVEDDENVAALATEMVQQLGYQVLRVGTAAAALGALSDGRAIDVVFSDIVMPGNMSGVDLAHEIRRRRPGLPVVLTTGYSGGAEADVQEGIPVLRKPYALTDLAKTLREAVAAVRGAQA
jgi:CheY-like chemotaxis protein